MVCCGGTLEGSPSSSMPHISSLDSMVLPLARAGQFSSASRIVLAISSIVALAVATSSSRPLLSSSARRWASTFSASCATFSRANGVPSAAALPLSGERCGSAVSCSRARVLAISHWPGAGW